MEGGGGEGKGGKGRGGDAVSMCVLGERMRGVCLNLNQGGVLCDVYPSSHHAYASNTCLLLSPFSSGRKSGEGRPVKACNTERSTSVSATQWKL